MAANAHTAKRVSRIHGQTVSDPWTGNGTLDTAHEYERQNRTRYPHLTPQGAGLPGEMPVGRLDARFRSF